jgi:hypothetical protein
MLSPEDEQMLGMPSTTNRRSSAVSQILRKISVGLKCEPVDWDVCDDENVDGHYHIRIATQRDLRQRAYALAHQVYHQCGFTRSEQGLIVSEYDAQPDTLTLLAQDDEGNDAGTLSLLFDSHLGLPADAIYSDELNLLRSRGRKLVEVTRLAIRDEHKHSKMLLTRLINFIFIFARRIKGFDDFVIEVTPRHGTYYRRLLQFEQIGAEKACPRVQNTVGVLLRLDLSVYEEKVRKFGGPRDATGDRTLYRHFYSWLEEGAVAEFLSRNHKPMSEEDKLHFGLTVPLAAAGN